MVKCSYIADIYIVIEGLEAFYKGSNNYGLQGE